MALRKTWLLAALLLPLAAGAQEKKGEARERIEYEKKTVINFDDDTIQGDLTRPDGEYVEARKKVNHSNLIKIREEWKDKVKQAAAEM
ncbi:MAG: adventurous gliding motility protein CglF [Deltaproteobacteria bacterium]|nr:adventurous gliding motility protein CglF [Deltaproteobacteria bacterium]